MDHYASYSDSLFPHLAPGTHSSTFFLYKFASPGHNIQMGLYNMESLGPASFIQPNVPKVSVAHQ